MAGGKLNVLLHRVDALSLLPACCERCRRGSLLLAALHPAPQVRPGGGSAARRRPTGGATSPAPRLLHI